MVLSPALLLAMSLPDLPALERMIRRFAPTELKVDTTSLAENERQALRKLIAASAVMNEIFLKQLWDGNPSLYARLRKDGTSLGKARLHYFWMNKGPWSDLDGHQAFLPGVPAKKPAGANLYPYDMTREEFEAWAKTLPREARREAEGFFTVIRRDKIGRLTTIPYRREYQADLERAASLLRQAAGLTGNASLRRFLTLRADAFLSDDYYSSDVAWMDLDAPIDLTIGPYETYNDELFGYKAAFEAYVNLRDERETGRLAGFAARLQEIENNLPIAAEYRNPKVGSLAPIRVVNQIYGAGDGNHGVQAAAYNLPNDERVVHEKGSKRVMLKNVQEAKFRSTLIPIAKRILPAAEQSNVNFDSFFTHILAHELSHGIGPHQIRVAGRATTPRQELKELYSSLEEAKADVTGLFMLTYLFDHGMRQSDSDERRLYVTYLASTFRSVRFGITEAHGRGTAMQFNYFIDHGAFRPQADGTFAVDPARMKSAVGSLAHELLTIEAQGDSTRAQAMLNRLGVVRPEMQGALDRLHDIPVDIEPVFTTAQAIAPEVQPIPSAARRY